MHYLYSIAYHVSSLVNKGGYLGIFVFMILESTSMPILIPSEVVLFSAGYLIANNEILYSYTLIICVLGTLIGSFINYFGAYLLGRPFIEKFGKYFGIKKNRFESLEKIFIKHSIIVTFIGRLLPFVKHIVSLPAGLCKMNLTTFTIFTTLGGLLFCSVSLHFGVLIGKGYFTWRQIKPFLVDGFLIFTILLIILYIAWNFFKKKHK